MFLAPSHSSKRHHLDPGCSHQDSNTTSRACPCEVETDNISLLSNWEIVETDVTLGANLSNKPIARLPEVDPDVHGVHP